MTGILLENFSYIVANTVIADVVKPVNKFNFNPLNDISASNNFIAFNYKWLFENTKLILN